MGNGTATAFGIGAGFMCGALLMVYVWDNHATSLEREICGMKFAAAASASDSLAIYRSDARCVLERK